MSDLPISGPSMRYPLPSRADRQAENLPSRQARTVPVCPPDLLRSYPELNCSLLVEEAEDKLVQNTETAIGLMKSVLENVRLPLFSVAENDLRSNTPARAPAEPLFTRQSTIDLLFHGSRDPQRESGCPSIVITE